MEEEKTKKNEKVVKKKKATRKYTKHNENLEIKKDDAIICNNDTKFVVKFVAIVCTFFSTVFAAIFLIFGIVSVLSAINLPKEQLIESNIVTSFLSKINGYSIAEIENSINFIDSKAFFILFEIIIPTAALICSMVLLIKFSRKLMMFFSDIRKEKDLFRLRKYGELRDMVIILSISLFILIALLNSEYIILFFIIEVLLYIILYLYKRCIKSEEGSN